MNLSIKSGSYVVCKLKSASDIPQQLYQSSFYSITKTDEELSLVCESNYVSNDVQTEKGWALIKVMGPLDFSLTGILASLANPLAEGKVSIFAISTFDTDYLLVQEANLEAAKQILEKANFKFV